MYDVDGEGLIEVKDYLKMIPSLELPLTLDLESLFKRLNINFQDWEGNQS